MPKVCTFLGPMRCGTSILSFSLFKHPEVYGIMNLSEKVHKQSGFDQHKLIDLYVPTMRVIAENEPRSKQEKHLSERQAKIVVERNHLPGKLWQKLDGSGFKILTIVRDPREVTLSVLKWHKMPRHNKNNKPEGPWVNGFLAKWKEAIHAYQQLKKNNDAYLVKHEDLCDDPITEGRKLFDWLGVSSSDEDMGRFAKGYKEANIRREDDNSYLPYITPDIIKFAEKVGYSL